MASAENIESCPICKDPMVQKSETRCSHIFCTECFIQIIKGNLKCPLCRAIITNDASKKESKVLPICEPKTQTLLDVINLANLPELETFLTTSKEEIELEHFEVAHKFKDERILYLLFEEWTRRLKRIQQRQPMRQYAKDDALLKASVRGNLRDVQKLIRDGANVNYADYEDYTPLRAAIRHRHFHIVRKLIKKGANINYVNKNGHTPLDEARSLGLEFIEHELQSNGAHSGKTCIIM